MEENIDTPGQDAQPDRTQDAKSDKTNGWNRNIVTDLSAPQFYSQQAIWGFSIFFSVIFGAVLLSYNVTDKKAKGIIIGFGILYTVLGITLLSMLPQRNSSLTLAFNSIGVFLLLKIFWDKYVGKETRFRTKPIWKALIISIIITMPILLAIIYGEK